MPTKEKKKAKAFKGMKLKDCKFGLLVESTDGRIGFIKGLALNAVDDVIIVVDFAVYDERYENHQHLETVHPSHIRPLK